MIDTTQYVDTMRDDVYDTLRELAIDELDGVGGGLNTSLIVWWWMNSCTPGTSYASLCP